MQKKLSTFNFGLLNRASHGMTLIEIAVVCGLIILLGGLGLTAGFGFYRTYSLNSERETVVSILRKSRSEAIGNKNSLPHGVRFESNRYISFVGNSYASRQTSYDQVFPFSPFITASGSSDVIFSQLSGSASSATITLSAGTPTRTITINQEGGIDW